MENLFCFPRRTGVWKAVLGALLGIFLIPTGGWAQNETGEDLVKVRLLADVEAIAPGQEFTAGLEFKMEPHWHIYWRNPGDSGLAPQVNWELPSGFEVGEIMWPVPKRIEDSGLVTYGYEDRVILLLKMTPSADLTPGQKVTLKADIDWLVCKDICLPGEGQVELTLPIVAANPLQNDESASLFTVSWKSLPSPQSDWTVTAQRLDKDEVELSIQAKPGDSPTLPESVYFFAYDDGVVSPNAEQVWESQDGGKRATLRLKLAATAGDITHLPGVLTADRSWGQGQTGEGKWEINPKLDAAAPAPSAGTATEGSTDTKIMPQAEGVEGYLLSLGLGGWLLLAFLGGLILNIMPCVLPVLSLKVFSLVKHAEQSRGMALAHGLAYTVGVVLSFLILAGVLLALRAGGEQVGWAFQLQSPTFVTLLTALLFLFGLNLFGVFEIGASLVGADATVSGRGDLLGSFFTGILAAVVGAPCIGPFLGAVTGLAVQLEPVTALLVFAVMGLGLASPFLLLAVFPQARVVIPKPGAWMETFKQFMGFLLMAAVIYFLWVLSTQGGVEGLIGVMLGLLIMSLGAWVYGRWNRLTYSRLTRVAAAFVALALLLTGGGYAVGEAEAGSHNQMLVNHAAKENAPNQGGWQTWSPQAVQDALAKDHPVFVDFTASWCLICQVNKRTVLRTASVEEVFAAANVIAFEADWTHRDSEIAQELAKYGRSGVPLYLLYSPADPTQPVILPQSLTQAGVIEAVDKLSK